MEYNFKDLKDKIKSAIDKRLENSELLKNEGQFIFVDGFTKIPIQDTLTANTVLGGSSIPAVTIIGGKSGRLYFFPLKILLPKLEI